MKHCATCHLEYADAKNFCGKCGKSLSVVHEASAQGMTCPACRATVRETWKFCGKCQAPLIVATHEATLPETRRAPTNGVATFAHQPSFSEASFIEPPSASEVTTCPSCGETIEADSVCCGFCGASIADDEATITQSDEMVGSYIAVSEEASSLNNDFLLLEQTIVDEHINSAEASYVSSEFQSAGLADEVDEPHINQSTAVTADETSPPTDVVPEKSSDASPAITPLIPPVFQPTNNVGRGGFDVSQLLHNKPVVLSLIALVAFASIGAFFVLKNTTSNSTSPDATQPQAIQSSDDSSSLAASVTTASSPSVATPSVPENMVLVSGGEFEMGRDGDDEYERPAHRVTVAPFYIDKYEVSRGDYVQFVATTGHAAPPDWKNGVPETGTESLPVTGINWDDANAYASWAGKRLPSEEEWEFAARGTDGRKYTWGNEWRASIVNAAKSSRKFAAVDANAEGASPYGVFNMVGNAWEWTASEMKPYPGGQFSVSVAGDEKVIRGGSWQSNESQATTTYRYGWSATNAKDYINTGFRCAKNAPR